jgi:transposase
MNYVGVDVSKGSLEVASVHGHRRSFHNSDSGIGELVLWLGGTFDIEQVRVVMEPTSTYHLPLVCALKNHTVAFTLINPSRSAAWTRIQGRRAKTDRQDALLLAQMGHSQQLPPSLPPDEQQEAMRSLSRHLDWLESEAQATRNRLEAARFAPWTPDAVLDSLERTLGQLEQEAKQVEQAIADHCKGHQNLSDQIKLLTSIPGVGERTATMILSELPSVQECPSAKSWVAFCGLNPEPRQSGNSAYSRLGRAGNARVRARLYLPAVSAVRFNPVIRDMSDRLKQRGKSGRQRIVAAMHKLLRLCFGVLKTGQPFDPNRNLVHLCS